MFFFQPIIALDFGFRFGMPGFGLVRCISGRIPASLSSSRPLSLSGRDLGNDWFKEKSGTSKGQIVPGDINKFVRVFGFKTENTSWKGGNVLYMHRRRLRLALASVVLTPFYIGESSIITYNF